MPNHVHEARLSLAIWYCLLFGPACGGLTYISVFLVVGFADPEGWGIEDRRVWLPGNLAVLIGWAIAYPSLRWRALHTVFRYIGPLGAAGFILFALFWVPQAGAGLPRFLLCIFTFAAAVVMAFVGLCGAMGRRYLKLEPFEEVP